MKSISFLPWKKRKNHSNTQRDRSIHDLSHPLTTSANSTSSTLVEPPSQRKRSVSLDRGQDATSKTRPLFSARPSTAPQGPTRRSHTLDKGYVRPRAPSDASWTLVGRPPLERLATPDTASTTQSPSKVSPLTTLPRAPKLSPTAANFHSHLASSPMSTPSSRTIRAKKSMPELDGVWKGFLEEMNENVDSIRLDAAMVDKARGLSRVSDAPRLVEAGLPTPVSAVPLSMSPTSPLLPTRTRAGSRSSNSPQSTVLESPRPYQSTSDGCIPISDARKRSLSPLLSPTTPSHIRDPSADFPLSLFPIPPPLHTPTARVRVLSNSPAPVIVPAAPLAEANSPPKPKPPPRSPARKNVPQPLDMRPGPRDAPPSPNLDSPPPSTPTTPRSPQSFPLPALRTASSVSTFKVKSTGGPGGHPFTTPLPSPPTTPDYYRYMSTSPELAEPYRSEKQPERPGLRPAYSSSQLRGYSTPPPGAHRATMSESVNPSGADAYLYPRPAPDPASHHVQWGYAV